MIFFIFRRVCLKGVLPYYAFNPLFITTEFTVAKEADDYYENKDDNKVFHQRVLKVDNHLMLFFL